MGNQNPDNGIMAMQLNNMAIFAAVVEAGTLSSAARMLGLPLSTVSRRIADLEATVGMSLLVRTTRSLKLTEAGSLYLTYCSDLVRRAKQAQNALQSLQDEPEGNIRMTVPFSIDSYAATSLTFQFMEEFKGVTIDLIVSYKEVSDDIEESDIVLSFGDKPVTHHQCRLLGHSKICFHASAGYVSANGAPLSVEQLGNHKLIGCSLFPTDRYSDFDLAPLKLAYRLNTNDLMVARHSCIDGLGLAWLPQMVCARAINSGELVTVLDQVNFALPIWLTTRNASQMSQRVRLLEKHLSEVFNGKQTWEEFDRRGW